MLWFKSSDDSLSRDEIATVITTCISHILKLLDKFECRRSDFARSKSSICPFCLQHFLGFCVQRFHTMECVEIYSVNNQIVFSQKERVEIYWFDLFLTDWICFLWWFFEIKRVRYLLEWKSKKIRHMIEKKKKVN